ncbi:MAG: ATP-binding protein, partial [Bacteroides sp.]|nr:ATP-binding protein [Bacteroides sp.]
KVHSAIQVCHQINEQNFTREYNGLSEAMDALNLTEGIIVTLNQTDSFEDNGKVVRMIPAYRFLSE